MWVIVGLFGLGGLGLAFVAFGSIASDIQLILMFVGLFGGVSMLALSDLLRQGSQIARLVRDLDSSDVKEVATKEVEIRPAKLERSPYPDFNTALEAYRKSLSGEQEHAIAIKKLAEERLKALGFLEV